MSFAPGLLTRLAQPPRKVAVVRASRIGDFVCATPAFRALRRALPAAEITLIALPFARELVARSPHLDRFEEFPGFPGIAEQFFDPRRTAGFLRRMRGERFDLALQLHGSGRYANPFTLMLGARSTAGFVGEGEGPGRLDAALPLPRRAHEIRRILALPAFLGAPARGEHPEFPLTALDETAARELLDGAERPLIGLHPAATDATKRWPPEAFAAAGTELLRLYGGTVVVLSGPGERGWADAVALAIGRRSLNLAGRTSLPVAGAAIARLDVLVTNDSGPAHIAYALGTPTVTIFGGTDPAEWGALGANARPFAFPVACRPCAYAECPIGYPCLVGTTVEEVVAAAAAFLPGAARAEE